MQLRFVFAIATVLFTTILSAQAREWTDSTGKHKQDADLVDFDEHQVILKKADGRLVAVPFDKLSAADQEYVRSKAGREEMNSHASKDRTWTMVDGSKLVGRVQEYGRRDVVLTRKNSKLFVNDKPWDQLRELHRLAVLMLVNHEEKKSFKDEKGIENLIVTRRGEPLKYTVEGVLMELEDGETFPLPFLLFTEKDLKVLKPGWQVWSAADADEKRKMEESSRLRSLANEYQKTRNAELQIQSLQLASQWFDLWEVDLVAPNGQSASVVVPARDSFTAEQAAIAKYPNGRIVGTRKIQRRY